MTVVKLLDNTMKYNESLDSCNTDGKKTEIYHRFGKARSTQKTRKGTEMTKSCM